MVKKITKPETLLTHIHPMHEGQRDFTCESKYEFCGKSFSQFNNLKTHTNIIHNDHTEGPNWNSVELKVKFLTEKLRVKII